MVCDYDLKNDMPYSAYVRGQAQILVLDIRLAVIVSEQVFMLIEGKQNPKLNELLGAVLHDKMNLFTLSLVCTKKKKKDIVCSISANF